MVFVTVTPPLILAYNSQQVAVYGGFLDELFEDTDVFEAAIPEIADDLAREIGSDLETRDMPIARLNATEWEHIINAVAPPDLMQKWAQAGVEGWRKWVRRGGRFLDDVVIPFGEVRANIVNDPDQIVLRTPTQAQPECMGGQEPHLSRSQFQRRHRQSLVIEPFERRTTEPDEVKEKNYSWLLNPVKRCRNHPQRLNQEKKQRIELT